jgi:hypothetical protein
VQFANIKDQVDGRFVHAKIIVAQTTAHDHVLFGSANCSDDALGTLSIAARNAEASIYRRLPRDSALAALDIDLSRTVDPADILRPEKDPPSPVRGAGPHPGVVELDVDRLVWTPPAGISPDGAALVLSEGAHLPVAPMSSGKWSTPFPTPPKAVLIVRVAYADGRVSGPTIVNDLRSLRRAAPGDYDKRLNAAIDKVLEGDGDLVDLALGAQALFSDGSSEPSQASSRAQRQEMRKAAPSGDFASAEEFREAVSGAPASGVTGRFMSDDPALHDVLAIVLRGISTVESRAGERLRGQIENADLDAGETEDGDDAGPDARVIPPAPATKRRHFTLEELELRKNRLQRVFERFAALTETTAKGSELPSASLPIQTVFILKLMVYACTHAYDLDNGTQATLMRLEPEANADNSGSFAVRAAKLLRALWRDTPQGSPVARLYRQNGQERLPDDLFFLTAMSRWAVIRARLAVASVPNLEKLDQIIAGAAAEIFRSTTRLGALDADAEEEFVTRLDRALGFPESATKALLNEWRQLLKSAPVQTLA